MALWGGRFTQAADKRFKNFNDSLRFDYRLAEQDIEGSIGWSKALVSVNILSVQEQQQLEQALNELLIEVRSNPQAILQDDAEDIHSWVESKLIDKVGNLGKKLHTGRSRNDQVALDIKMWCKERVAELQHSVRELQRKLVFTAENNQEAVMPGYTHLQRAQPITFAHWCMAYVEMLDRDYSRLADAYRRMNSCPLGSGALAGTAYPIDREQLAKDLNFAFATRNSLDSVSDRDHIVELLSAASLSMVHLSRFAEDMIIFNSGESNFVELSDRVTSGSSLMPQKKNPDACELIRGKAGRVIGALNGMLMTLKGLPLAYNKDMQEDKEGIFDALDTWQDCLDMASLVLDDIKVNVKRTRESALKGYSNATELADYLVAKGVPFRDSHHIVGETVVYAIKQHKALEDLTIPEFRQFCEKVSDDVYDILSLQSCLDKRAAKGGVSPLRIAEAIAEAKKSNTFTLNENKQVPKAPNLPEYQRDTMDEFFEDIKFLASFIGCNIFEITKPKEEHIFYTKGRGGNAKGFYSSSGFTVLKGSVIAEESTPSFHWKEKREKLLSEYTTKKGLALIVTSDITFSSPSTAAMFCLGRSANGWDEWKDKEYRTLDVIYRKQLE